MRGGKLDKRAWSGQNALLTTVKGELPRWTPYAETKEQRKEKSAKVQVR